ncbi:DUF4287 domain-containing protein [Pseudonocardia sp. KRD291]|uniref:DUF4287 domain-containing protein n=1 Tax=Pseudonocardia sp. KRD291 TaxID=2792007 RepID=UPI001C49F0B8|nr:DUF4287 domain-containing protein [Pseudonocardia sp. KRD291]MBW0102760.1 DUF4287 domain-containing protein [Pseudonocardia sp. KRD291]
MSFQAYLDKIEEKTGKVPAHLVAEARERGFDSSTKPAEILAWLKQDYDLGRGHGMALAHVIRNGTSISDKHVGTTGAHRDETNELRLDGIANR